MSPTPLPPTPTMAPRSWSMPSTARARTAGASATRCATWTTIRASPAGCGLTPSATTSRQFRSRGLTMDAGSSSRSRSSLLWSPSSSPGVGIMQLNLDSAVWILAPNDAVVPDSPARRVREQAGRTQVQQLPCPNVSWKRDALVAFSGELRDEGVASPPDSLHEGAILGVPYQFVSSRRANDYASSPERPDSQVAPVFDWRKRRSETGATLGSGLSRSRQYAD